MYYMNFLSPAVKSRSLMAYPLELALLSTGMKKNAPILSGEVVTASSTINGNLASLLADFKQRKINTENRLMGLLAMIREKRKYVSYTMQMEEKCGRQNTAVFVDPDNTYFDAVFVEAVVDQEKRETLNSSHKYFSDLGEDHHPQYLLRSGGEISGDLTMAPNVMIAGVNIPTHSHSGSDGSARIKASSIDYSQDRNSVAEIDPEKIFIEIDSFSEKITLAGDPLVDTTVSVKLDQDIEDDKYEIRITYTELEKEETIQ